MSLLPRLARHPKGIIGVLILVLLLVAGGAPESLAVYSPTEQDLPNRLSPPSGAIYAPQSHPLGTDQLGRDILSRLVHGARVSLLVALAAVVIAGLAGVLLGLVAGYYGGGLEAVVMRAADIQLSLPSLVLALALVAILGTGLLNIVVALSFAGWPSYCRVVRAEVLAVRETEYVAAAKSLGASDFRIVTRHILRNVIAPVIVLATLQGANVILAEASLSYLGVGIQPPTISWGLMVNGGRDVLVVAWWVAVVPAATIMMAVLGFYFFGDFLREVLDPRRRGG